MPRVRARSLSLVAWAIPLSFETGEHEFFGEGRPNFFHFTRFVVELSRNFFRSKFVLKVKGPPPLWSRNLSIIQLNRLGGGVRRFQNLGMNRQFRSKTAGLTAFVARPYSEGRGCAPPGTRSLR